MIKKSKGFTLVELLAVIVILAIIALIATPIILNIIEGARKDAAKASALGYERAVNLKIMDGELTGKPIEDNEYDINEIEVTVSGKAPDEGEVTIEGKEVVEYTLRFGEYTVTKTKDGSVKVAKGNVEMITFTIEGQSFTVAKGTLLKDVPGLEALKIKEDYKFVKFKIGDQDIDENEYKIESTVAITIEWEKVLNITIDGHPFKVEKGTILKNVSGFSDLKIKNGYIFKNFKIEEQVITEEYVINSEVIITIEWEEDPSAKGTIARLVPTENFEKASGTNGTIENLGKYGIRYRGKDPENYVEFNGETWRIIGIVDGYMKIISESLKDSSTGSELSLSWDNKNTSSGAETAYGKNEWTEARLMKLLNPNYGSETYGGSLYWNSGKGKCYSGNNNATKDCDFTNTGLKKESQDMIAEVTWKLGGWSTVQITKEAMYDKERGTETYSGREKTWKGFVGLMYPSDYGFAASKECSQTLNRYDHSPCVDDNWLYIYNRNYYWTLAPGSSDSCHTFTESSSARVENKYTNSAHGVKAVVHLKSDVKIISGSGKSTDPYKLKL